MELRACSLIYFPNIIDSMYDTIILLKYRINYEQAVELLYALSETLEYLNLIYDNFSANLKIFFELKLCILLIREIESKSNLKIFYLIKNFLTNFYSDLLNSDNHWSYIIKIKIKMKKETILCKVMWTEA